jgi:hypothetical protein
MEKTVKTWSFKELSSLSSAKNLPDSEQFQVALGWKRRRVKYHAEEYHEIWRHLFSSSDKIQMGGVDWGKAQLAAEANVEAAAQVMHSMADILAQIINKTILKGELKEHSVTLSLVLKKLEKKLNSRGIVSSINKFMDSTEYKYINAFVNTIKHQRLLDITYNIEPEKGTSYPKGICFKEFEYKGKKYERVFAVDILDSYKSYITDLIIDIGHEVNNYISKYM